MTAANLDTELRPGSGLHARQSHRGAYVALDDKPYMMLRPPLLRRVFRASARFVFAVLLGIGGTLAWESHGDEAIDVIRAKAPSVADWLPASTSRQAIPVGGAEVQQPPKANLAVTDQQSTPTAAAGVGEVQQQLAPITVDLAALKEKVEQLTANEEKIAQSIARLEASEKGINQKLSSLASPNPTIRAPQPKSLNQTGQASARAQFRPSRAPSAQQPLRP